MYNNIRVRDTRDGAHFFSFFSPFFVRRIIIYYYRIRTQSRPYETNTAILSVLRAPHRRRVVGYRVSKKKKIIKIKPHNILGVPIRRFTRDAKPRGIGLEKNKNTYANVNHVLSRHEKSPIVKLSVSR